MSVAKKYNIDYIECSAANATNIRLVFETIARKVLKSIQGESSGKEEQKDRLMAQGIVRNKKKSCC